MRRATSPCITWVAVHWHAQARVHKEISGAVGGAEVDHLPVREQAQLVEETKDLAGRLHVGHKGAKQGGSGGRGCRSKMARWGWMVWIWINGAQALTWWMTLQAPGSTRTRRAMRKGKTLSTKQHRAPSKTPLPASAGQAIAAVTLRLPDDRAAPLCQAADSESDIVGCRTVQATGGLVPAGETGGCRQRWEGERGEQVCCKQHMQKG